MKNQLELVRYGPETVIASEAGLVRRDEDETTQIVESVLEQAEGDVQKARLILDLTLVFLNHGPVWGRSLFLTSKAELYPLKEVFATMDVVILTEGEKVRTDLVRLAFEGMLRQPYFGQLYLAMVEDLGGDEAMVMLKAKLRTVSGNDDLTEGGRQLYRQTAGKSAWVWDDGSLLKTRSCLVRYRNNLLAGLATDSSFPMMAVMAGEVAGQIADLDKILDYRGVKF